jgi:hypothetical protein
METLTWIRGLVIPPAWRDVWICPLAYGHLQASGATRAAASSASRGSWSGRRRSATWSGQSSALADGLGARAAPRVDGSPHTLRAEETAVLMLLGGRPRDVRAA